MVQQLISTCVGSEEELNLTLIIHYFVIKTPTEL